MKTSNFSTTVLVLAGLLALTACEPKNEPRWEQEPAKDWSVKSTPADPEVKTSEYGNYDLSEGFALTKDAKGDLTARVLLPLARIVLNREFIEQQAFRTARLRQMIAIFNAAFVTEMDKSPRHAEFEKIKQDYINTVFAGCTRDLKRDCRNATLFAGEGRHTLIMTKLARELDEKIEAELKTAGTNSKCIESSAACRNLIEERYRFLAMGANKSNRYSDPEYAFAYLKYARLFSTYIEYMKKTTPVKGQDYDSMSSSYLAQMHGQIFETLITKYKPKDLKDPEFRAFVENFNPWGYSRRQADMFQYGTGVMFELGAKCCLYQDTEKTQLSKSVREAIDESQKDKDSFGLSFRQIVADIKKEYGNRLFTKLQVNELIADIERPESNFYNEYFFIVDRLFRGHLSSEEIDLMLRNTNPKRARVELPKMIASYVKVYLVYMTVETNRFMASIYHSNLASDQIFEQSVIRSRELTGRWYKVQAQIDLLDKLMNSYFKDLLITSPEYSATFNLLKAVNRNIHYISVFPNMTMMTYYLSKMKGSISFDSWWGRVEIDSSKILKDFFDGNTKSPWFRFGKDTEELDRLMLLYSIEYMLSTESIDSFVAKDVEGSDGAGSNRSRFFDTIFTKYLGESQEALLADLNKYENNTLGNASFTFAKEVCAFELGSRTGLPPSIMLNFQDLDKYTYTGLESNSINGALREALTGPISASGTLVGVLDRRRTFVRAMMDVIEGDLLRTGAIKQPGEPHPDLESVRRIMKQLDDTQVRLTKLFIASHKKYFECSVRLREIERRRINRLYDEERAHLARIFEEMKPLVSIQDPKELADKVKEINARVFTEANGYKFDRIDGLNYRLSKYDLLMRMKKRIEADIFATPTDKERANYGASLAAYTRPRSVSVYMPEAVVRSEMYAQGTNTAITLNGSTDADRDEFIRQGMAVMNGKTGSFIQWRNLQSTDVSFKTYLDTLESFYVLPKVAGQEDEVTPADLVNAYTAIFAGETLDAYGIEYAKMFDTYGNRDKEFFVGFLFERDGMTRLPFYFNLMVETTKKAGVELETKGTPVYEALDFAKRFNSVQAFVFQPSPVVRETVMKNYGDRAHTAIAKITDLFDYLSAKDSAVTDSTQIDPRLAQPVYLENNTLTSWHSRGSKNLIDGQRVNDHRIRIGDFVQRSGNFFGTKEKVKAQ